MWPNNGFHGHETFQQDQQKLYQGQGNYQQPFLDDGYIPFSPVPFAPPYFLQPTQPQPMQYNSGSGQSSPSEYEPQADLYNKRTVAENGFPSLDDPERYGQFRQAMASQGAARPALNARAEELKARLMRTKERGNSGTPPVPTSTSNQSRPKEAVAPVSESSQIPSANTVASFHRSSGVVDEDLNDLISEAKAAAHMEKGKPQSELNVGRPTQQPGSQSAKNHVTAAAGESCTKVLKHTVDSPNSHEKFLKEKSRYNDNGEHSDISEGEVQENSKACNSRPLGGPKESRTSTKLNKEIEQVRDDENGKARQRRDNREASPLPRSSSGASAPHHHDDRNDEAEERTMRKMHLSNNRYERNHHSEADQRSYLGRDARETDEERGRKQVKHIIDKEDKVLGKLEPPTLAQLIAIDEDLRDWLDITRYHDVEYRTKTLNRRRAIAALDAQKAKLLAEMEMEERGGFQPTPNAQTSVPGMLPPPIPGKVNTNASPLTVTPLSKKDNDLPVREAQERSFSTSINQEPALKRTYSEYQESRDEVSVEKLGRVDEQGRGIRIKSEHHIEERRPSSSDYNSTRRRSSRSISPGYRTKSHGRRDARSETRSRDQGRSFGHHRDMSPDKLTYQKRPRARSKSYDFPSPKEQNRTSWKDPEYVPKGTYVERGNYRGRAYNPNYRGRGGRGRGKTWNELGEGRFEHRESSQTQSHGSRLASLKPYKDPKPLDKGGKGDTRYFIVKSFNEDNVMKCIEDSIWTTQKDNGKIFNTAFLTCKNVIFVFSVNHSRAFQGYARMESSPGTETALPWMNTINWESAGAFKVKWLCVANTRFSRVGHLKNNLNENQPVLVGRDGQEIEEHCGEELLKLLDDEADHLLARRFKDPVRTLWDD